MDKAEKQGIVDGLLTFFVALGGTDLAAHLVSTPAVAEASLVTAGIAGAISGLNSYRRAARLNGGRGAPP